MRVPRVYAPGQLTGGAPIGAGGSVTIDGVRAHYLTHVLRRVPGDAIEVFDGDGRSAPAVIARGDRHGLVATLAGAVAEEAPPRLPILLALSLVKGNALDHAVQKATELGAAAIALLVTERSERRVPADRVPKLLAHLRGIASAACEQCGRNRLPGIATPVPLADWLAALPATAGAARWLLQPGQPPPPFHALANTTRLSLLVGPEGGFSGDEAAAAGAAGFRPTGLGPRVLRADTAPVVALALAQYLAGGLAADGFGGSAADGHLRDRRE